MPPRRRHDSVADADDEPSSSSKASSSRKAPQTKKTRFVSPSDDPATFADDVEDALEKPSVMTRKGRVKTEGYESDSSDDGEGVVLSRREKNDTAAGDEDDDMFAMGEKEDKEDADESGKPKKQEFLRLGDIEGQEFNDEESDGKEDDSEVSDEPEDEDDAERRKKAGMGYELTSFNMREEFEEGKFDADGTFVRTFDPHAMHDRWMDGTDEREIKKARRAKRAQEKKEKERIRAEQREAESGGRGKEDMEKELLDYLKRGESVLEAISRLGERVKQEKENEKKERKTHLKSETMDTDNRPARKPVTSSTSNSKAKALIDRITTLASELMALGDIEVYSKTYEQFLRSVRSSGNVEPDWVPPVTKYEYKWDVLGATTADGAAEQAFGPFGEEEMKAWYDAQYFGSVGEKVKVRVVGGEWGSWDDVIQ